jgi:hypothetical protein
MHEILISNLGCYVYYYELVLLLMLSPSWQMQREYLQVFHPTFSNSTDISDSYFIIHKISSVSTASVKKLRPIRMFLKTVLNTANRSEIQIKSAQ